MTKTIDLSGIDTPEGCARILRAFVVLAVDMIDAPGDAAADTLREVEQRIGAALRASSRREGSLLARVVEAAPDADRRRHVLQAVAGAIVEHEHARRIERRARLARAGERRLAYEWRADPERLALLRESSRFDRPRGRPETPAGRVRDVVQWAAEDGWAALAADLARVFLDEPADAATLRATSATLRYRRRS